MRSTRKTRGLAAAAAVFVVPTSLAAIAAPAAAATTITYADAAAISAAMTSQAGLVTGASFVTASAGRANAVVNGPLGSFFPTDGPTSGLLTTGDAQGLLSQSRYDTRNGGGPVRGAADRDVTILETDVTVPAGDNCLTFAFQFLSTEFPVFVGQAYNDAFVAELDTSTWTTAANGTVTAPDNFAFDPTGAVVSVNSTGVTSFSTANAAGTAYAAGDHGATVRLSASTPITPGAHSLYLSIFDQGDDRLDSAVLLDGLRTGVAGPGGCVSGAQQSTLALSLAPETATLTTGEQHTLTATVTDNDVPADDEDVLFVVTGANPGTYPATTAGGGTAAVTYPGTTAGTDSVTSCVDVNGNGVCDPAEASDTVTVTWVEAPPEENRAPAFVAPTPADGTTLTTTVGSAVEFAVAADDPDDGDTVTLGLGGTPEGATFTSTPGDPASGTFTWTPTVAGTTVLTLTATDDEGAAAAPRTVTIVVEPASTGPTCGGLPATIVGSGTIYGTPGDDVIVGGPGRDKIYGGGGDDVICGMGGNDDIYGGDGDDIIYGGDGNDYINGGDGDDILYGEDGHDMIIGGNGNDVLRGGPLWDKLDGGPGDDDLSGDEGFDLCVPGPGTNVVSPTCEDVR